MPNFDGAVCAVIPHAYGTIKFPLPTQSHRLDPAIPESSPDRSRSQAQQRRKPAISRWCGYSAGWLMGGTMAGSGCAIRSGIALPLTILRTTT